MLITSQAQMKEHAPKPKQNAVASFDFVQSQIICVETLMLVQTKLATTMGKLSGFSRYSRGLLSCSRWLLHGLCVILVSRNSLFCSLKVSLCFAICIICLLKIII